MPAEAKKQYTDEACRGAIRKACRGKTTQKKPEVLLEFLLQEGKRDKAVEDQVSRQHRKQEPQNTGKEE